MSRAFLFVGSHFANSILSNSMTAMVPEKKNTKISYGSINVKSFSVTNKKLQERPCTCYILSNEVEGYDPNLWIGHYIAPKEVQGFLIVSQQNLPYPYKTL